MGCGTAVFVPCLVILAVFGLSLSAPLQRQESLQKLEELKTKLGDLHTVIEELEQDLTVKTTNERKELNEDGAQLADFESTLSEADRELLHKMKSRVKYLHVALQSASSGNSQDKRENNLSDDELKAKYPSFAHYFEDAKTNTGGDSEEETQKREQEDVVDPDMQSLFEHLSPEDQKLLEAHPSEAEVLRNAFNQKNQASADNEEQRDSDGEAALLETMKSRLTALKQSLEKQRQEKCKTDPNCKYEPELTVYEGKFKDFVNKKLVSGVDNKAEKQQIGWMQSSVDDTTQTEKCKDEDCNKPDISHDERVLEVKQKLLKDLSYAKENGVSTNEILNALVSARKERNVRNEAEMPYMKVKSRMYM